jgi:hypothetical protein
MPTFHGYFDVSCSLDISPSSNPINGNVGSGTPVHSLNSSSYQCPTNSLGSITSENMDEHAVDCADLEHIIHIYMKIMLSTE